MERYKNMQGACNVCSCRWIWSYNWKKERNFMHLMILSDLYKVGVAKLIHVMWAFLVIYNPWKLVLVPWKCLSCWLNHKAIFWFDEDANRMIFAPQAVSVTLRLEIGAFHIFLNAFGCYDEEVPQGCSWIIHVKSFETFMLELRRILI